MTSTSFNVGLNGVRNSSKVLKPPGGGSSDIFGGSGSEQTTPEPRRNRSQQASNLFLGSEEADHSSAVSKSPSPASNKPGNDSYQRLFGESELPKTPASGRNRMKSNICLEQIDTVDSHKITNNHNHIVKNNIINGNAHALTNSDKSSTNTTKSSTTNTTPRSLTPKSHPSTPNGNLSPREGSGKASLYTPRNPVTGDGYGFVPVRKYYSARRKDGNPVTGEGYENAKSQLSNGGSASSQSSAAPNNSAAPAASSRQRVPPGGFSSGLW